MAKKISMTLSIGSIKKAMKEIEKYKKDIHDKCELLCKRLAKEGIQIAQAHVGESKFWGRYIHLSSEITPEKAGCKAVLRMEDTSKIISRWQTKEGVQSATVSPMLMLEFGSGLKAENPAGIQGVGTGTFPGGTHGGDSGGWWYMDLDGNWHHSTGTDPKMPMYFAREGIREKLTEIAKEIFES